MAVTSLPNYDPSNVGRAARSTTTSMWGRVSRGFREGIQAALRITPPHTTPPEAMDIASALREAKTIAVVGCSPRPTHTSHYIAKYLLASGYEVIPVNPYHEALLGEACYPDLCSIPNDREIDIVNVFRRSNFTAATVRDAAARAEATGQRPLIWTQLGVHSSEAEQLAREAGLPYVAERCIMVDHGRLTV